jgi:hypothetical protein
VCVFFEDICACLVERKKEREETFYLSCGENERERGNEHARR